MIMEEVLKELGEDADCCICEENLVVNDKMQELPFKHTFHPPCLKPWLDAHSSCPICRHGMQTDDRSCVRELDGKGGGGRRRQKRSCECDSRW